MEGNRRRGKPVVPPGILRHLTERYKPVRFWPMAPMPTGPGGPHSDFDALVLTDGGAEGHDTAFVDGVQLDVFIYPAGFFDGDFSPGDFPQLADAALLLDRDGRGKGADRPGCGTGRPDGGRRPGRAPGADGMVPQDAPANGTRRCGGMFRWHWLLTDSLEICCGLLGTPYQGPKKSLRWLGEAARRDTDSMRTPWPAWTPPPWSGGCAGWRSVGRSGKRRTCKVFHVETCRRK